MVTALLARETNLTTKKKNNKTTSYKYKQWPAEAAVAAELVETAELAEPLNRLSWLSR